MYFSMENSIQESETPLNTPVNSPKTYYINRMDRLTRDRQLYCADSPDIIYSSSISDNNERPELVIFDDDSKDTLSIYIAAVISFFVPFVGFFYLLCFRSKCCNDGLNTRRKRKAYRVLFAFTMTNLIISVVFITLYKFDRLKL